MPGIVSVELIAPLSSERAEHTAVCVCVGGGVDETGDIIKMTTVNYSFHMGNRNLDKLSTGIWNPRISEQVGGGPLHTPFSIQVTPSGLDSL